MERHSRFTLLRFPEYPDAAKALGARAFNTPEKIWAGMTVAQREAHNITFIDKGIAKGATFVVETGTKGIGLGTALEREIKRLLDAGYTWSKDGKALKPPL